MGESKIVVEIQCRDHGQLEGCLRVPDDRYTMHFDDIGEDSIYFCSSCGPLAQTMVRALEAAAKRGGDVFLKDLDVAITKIETENRAKQS